MKKIWLKNKIIFVTSLFFILASSTILIVTPVLADVGLNIQSTPAGIGDNIIRGLSLYNNSGNALLLLQTHTGDHPDVFSNVFRIDKNGNVEINGGVVENGDLVGHPKFKIDTNGNITTAGSINATSYTINGQQFTGGSGSSYWASTTNNVYNTNSGNIGIGTNDPQQQLSIGNGFVIDQNNADDGSNNMSNRLSFGSYSGEGIGSERDNLNTNGFSLEFYTSSAQRMIISNHGNVAIGTSTAPDTIRLNVDKEGVAGDVYGIYSVASSTAGSSSGVYGEGDYGIYGVGKNIGVYAFGPVNGVFGSSVDGYGVYGSSESSNGVYGFSNSGFGVSGYSYYGTAVYGNSPWGYAGQFEGSVYIGGVGSEGYPYSLDVASSTRIQGNLQVNGNIFVQNPNDAMSYVAGVTTQLTVNTGTTTCFMSFSKGILVDNVCR